MNPLLQRLGWTLLHSLWEGAAAWIALRFALATLRRRSAQLRYVVACMALAVGTVAPWVTFFQIDLAQRLVSGREPAEQRAAPANFVAAPPSAYPEAAAAVAIAPFTGNASSAPVLAPWTRRMAPILPWLVFAWAIGAAIGASRLASEWSRVRRLSRATGAPLPAAVDALFSRLCAAAGRAGRVTARVSEWVTVPTVIGCLKPLVLLPPAMLLQLTPLQLEAVLAHELAHIRRYDFAVNLLQAIGETIFYYHPAIRAINRCIRLEREQACDDAALAATGNRLAYAEALATLAEFQAPALALAARGSPGTLRQRIGRILGTDTRGPSLGSTALAAAGLYVVLLLAAPALTAQIMTAAERIRAIRAVVPPSVTEQLAQAELRRHPHAGGPGRAGATMRVMGEVRGPDGALLDRDLDLFATSSREHASISVDLPVRHGRFSATVPAGALWIESWPKGFAPVVAGPFLPAAGTDTVSPITLTLRRGNPVRLRFMADDGQPVAGVSVRGTVHEPGAPVNGILMTFPARTSDKNGAITVDGVDTGTELHLRLQKPGFQMQVRTLRDLARDGIIDVPMSPAASTQGQVVDAETGQRVANARIVLAARRGTGDPSDDSYWGQPEPADAEDLLAVTDASGRFAIDTLNQTWMYRVYVEATGYQIAVEPLAAGDRPEYRLDRGLRLAGRVRGLPPGPATITCWYPLQLFPTQGAGTGDKLELSDTGAERTFSFEHLPPGPITLRVAGTGTAYKMNLATDDDRVVYDVAALRKRDRPTQAVTITFNLPADASPPVGEIEAMYRHVREVVSGRRTAPYYGFSTAAVQNGRIELPAVAAGDLQLRATGLIGYWFADQTFKIDATTPTRLITLDVLPAGAIRAKVIDAAGGSLPRDGMMDCLMQEPPRGVPTDTEFLLSGRAANADSGVAMFTPVPLGGTYEIVWMRGCAVAVSDAVSVDPEHPLATTAIVKPRGVDLHGIVVDERGAPVPLAEVSFSYDSGHKATMNTTVGCGPDGRFTLRSMNWDVPGTYELSSGGSPEWWGSIRLTRDTPQPIRLVVHRRLRMGRTVIGR